MQRELLFDKQFFFIVQILFVGKILSAIFTPKIVALIMTQN